jgi:hypothetical protein
VSQISWGSNADTIVKSLEKTEWKLTQQKPDLIEFKIRYEGEAADTGLLKDLPNEPHTLTFFLNSDRAAIVQMIRKDSRENLAAYHKKAEEMYGLKKPAWESGEKVFKNEEENGGMITESVKIYETDNHLAKVVYNKIDADLVPEKMKSAVKNVFADRLEIILYSKKENQGLSVSALSEFE